MTDTKTFVIPDGAGGGNLDPNLLLSMNGGGNNAQLAQIQDTLNTNQGNTLLMDAIKGNQTANPLNGKRFCSMPFSLQSNLPSVTTCTR